MSPMPCLCRHHVAEAEGTACWYAPLRKNRFCREQFDFADHVVLFVSQYLSIQTFEAIAILSEVRRGCINAHHHGCSG